MDNPNCLDTPCLETQASCLASLCYDPFSHLRDMIEHEYALVESVPDEDRHALMPIIRFVRNTLQDPFRVHHHYATYNGQICDRGGLYHGSDRMKACANHEIAEMQFRKASCMMDMKYLLLPSKKAISALTSEDPCHYGLSGHAQKDVYNISSDMGATSCDNYAAPFQTLKKFDLNYMGHDQGQDEVYRLTTFSLSRAHESESTSLPGLESFNMDEIGRSLRPHGDSDSYVDNGHDGECGDDGDNEAKEYAKSFLAYDTDNRAASDMNVSWHACWGDESYFDAKSSGYTPLQFPKLHRRKRSVIKKAVGWVKRRSTLFFASRVRQKRKCSLPCCMDSETRMKRRKGSEYASKKCDKRSRSKLPSPSKDDQEKKKHDNGVLLSSGSQRPTAWGATERMVRQGHLEVSGLDKEFLLEHVKTTLTECPEFTELRNSRYVLQDLGRLQGHPGIVSTFHSQIAGEFLYEEHDDSSDETNLSQGEFLIPDHGHPQCHKIDREQGQCSHYVKLGSFSHEQHPQGGGTPAAKVTFCSDVRRDAGDCDYGKAHKEEMVETVVNNLYGKSQEQDVKEGAHARCCMSDSKNCECSNQAKRGSGCYEARDKKGTWKSANKRKFKKLEYITQDNVISTVDGSLRQLRPIRRLQVF